MSNGPSVLLLNPNDNVLVCTASIRAGEPLLIDGRTVVATEDISLGHKISRHSLAAGDKVLKYGVAIGSMTAAVAGGAHVHLHNMESDYIPSHTRQAAGGNSQ
jgi:(2R)-sulfolactate sulfo-lyase subunit alpha